MEESVPELWCTPRVHVIRYPQFDGIYNCLTIICYKYVSKQLRGKQRQEKFKKYLLPANNCIISALLWEKWCVLIFNPLFSCIKKNKKIKNGQLDKN